MVKRRFGGEELHVPLEMGVGTGARLEQHVICYRAGRAQRMIAFGGEERSEDPISLFPWSVRLECSQGVPVGVGGLDNGMSRGKNCWRRSRSIGDGHQRGRGDSSRCSTTEPE